MRRLNSNDKGITLIALIITIIVLLILSLVTINSLFGSDSALDKARQARENNEKGEISDMLALAIANIKLEHAESQKEINEYYEEPGEEFIRAGKISATLSENSSEGSYIIQEYRYNNDTKQLTLKVKKRGGTGIAFEYEINVGTGSISYKGGNQTGNNGGKIENNGGSETAQTYNINYDTKSGSFENGIEVKRTYNKGEIVRFLSPVRSNFVFDGWYTDEGYDEESAISQTSETSEGDITVYAKWIAESNLDYFKFSEPDENGDVTLTGLTKNTEVEDGVVSGEQAYTNNADDIINLVIPQKDKNGNIIKNIKNNAFDSKSKIRKLVIQRNIETIRKVCI